LLDIFYILPYFDHKVEANLLLKRDFWSVGVQIMSHKLRFGALAIMIWAIMILAIGSLGLGGHDALAKAKRHKPAAAVAKKPLQNTGLAPVTLDEPRGPYIEEAPTDDFQRVAWCHGTLSAHMELAEKIKDISPLDPQIQAIGASYLRAYEAALTLSKKGENETGHSAAEGARQKGYNSWALARKAKIEKTAWAYNTWQLPGECEQATVRLSGHEHIFAEMATDEEADIIAATLSSSQQASNALPAPKIKAQNAPEDPNAPVATKRVAPFIK
jgi:hypothetical protein